MAYGARQAFRERQAKVRRRFEQADTERGSARRVYCGSDRVLCPRLAGNSSGAGTRGPDALDDSLGLSTYRFCSYSN